MLPPLDPLDLESPMEIEDHAFDSDMNVDAVLQMVQRPMYKGQAWYLVDKRWFERFEKYVVDKDPALDPGVIDNSKLFESAGDPLLEAELRDHLQEEVDYKFVPEDAWQILYNHFGTLDANQVVRRWVIEEGVTNVVCVVEVYLTDLKLCRFDRPAALIHRSYSRTTKLYDLENDMKGFFAVPHDQETRLHHLNTALETDDGKTLADVSISQGDIVSLEVRNADGSWPSVVGRPSTTRSSNARSYTPGLCGLTNLGNTCFMNSALQCLSNTRPLTEFITSDRYLAEINRKNPLGMEGRIADTYGDMIKNMWSGTINCFTPRSFKYVVGCFAPQFSGFAQQDCQELMAFLLDGLHEDFNRITDKPYIEQRANVDQRPDHIVAAESWANYKKRNDSIIVDTFHGLLKSTLVCPECKMVSVTFDPFCYLSLPLPAKREKQIDVVFVPAVTDDSNGNGNTDFETEVAFTFSGLSVPKHGLISDICRALADAVNRERVVDHPVDPQKLIVTDVVDHRLAKIYESSEMIASQMTDLVIYEMPLDGQPLAVYLREVRGDGSKVLFGRPFYIGGTLESDYASVMRSVTNHLKYYCPSSSAEESTDSDEAMSGCRSEVEPISLTITNSEGKIDIEQLVPNQPIRLFRSGYLAVDLPTETKAKCYSIAHEIPLRVAVNKSVNQLPKSTGLPLSECINNFTTTEKLGAEDSWYCPKCKEHQQATKKFDLWQLPNVLIIHLKRFSYSRFWRDKLETLVDYPITGLDMGRHVINNPDQKPMLYDLIAVSNHYGSLGGGHYTAYAKNKITNRWHYFNDSSVSDADESNVVSKSGYVLYYLKRSDVTSCGSQDMFCTTTTATGNTALFDV